MSEKDEKIGPYPMRIQVMPGSEAEYHYYEIAARHNDAPIERAALAPGVKASPRDDLVFRGGKTLPHMGFQNIYLGRASDFAPGDQEAIDDAITRLVRDERLKAIIQQYFPGRALAYDVAPSVILDESRPNEMDEADVEGKIVELFDQNQILTSDHDRTCFNLLLPRGTTLKLGRFSSRKGLGGFHGSVHFNRRGRPRTLYYSANVYSTVAAGAQNGIPFFKDSWKNVVCTLYHELIEFQTDPDVSDAVRQNDVRFIGWNSNRGEEIGDQPLSANTLDRVFKEILTLPGSKATPVQFLYSNAVHGAEGPTEMAPRPELVIDGAVVGGQIGVAGERDVYSLKVAAPGTYSIGTSGRMDTFLSLLDMNERVIAEDDNDGPGSLSLIVRHLDPGQYIVRVRHHNSARTGNYGIAVKTVPDQPA